MPILENNFKQNKTIEELYRKSGLKSYPLEKTKNNSYTYKINECYIHSKYDPVKEAARTADILTNDSDEIDVYIVFGCGIGYLIKELFDRVIKSDRRKIKPYILYIEKDIRSFITALEVSDYTELLNSEYVKFFIDSEKELIGSLLQSLPSMKVRYYYHRPLYMAYENYYREVQNYINYVLDRKDMNTATMQRFQKVWTRNTLFNLPFLIRCQKLNTLKNTASGLTAVVTAGGPTLSKVIPYIKEYRNNLIVITVDTSYKYLKSNGITADVVVSVDPQFWNFKYLDDENLDESILITDPTSYYQLFRGVSSDRIFTGNSIFPLTSFFMDNKDRGVLSAGGSVSTTAFDTARILGCDNIILAGLDLGFPDRNTHFKGAFFETNFIAVSDYYRTVEQKSIDYIAHAGLVKAESTNGTVLTDPKMVLFRNWFDREIPLTESSVYLPDLGGSMIQGCKIFKIEDFCNLPVGRDISSFKKRISGILNIERDKEKSINSFKNDIDLFLNHCREIHKISSDIISIIPEDGKIKENNIGKYEKLNSLIFEDLLLKKTADIIAGSAQDILLSIMENVRFSNDEKISLWIKTRKLFEAVNEMSVFYKNIFSKLVKLMDNLPNIYTDSL